MKADDYFVGGSFQALAAALMAANGGTVEFSPRTYIVGSQDGAFTPADIFNLSGISGAVTLRGNGARLRLADGLRFGTFDAGGIPTINPMPYLGEQRRDPVNTAILYLHENSGAIAIEDLELDGNLANLLLGGPYGDVGWQVPGDGLALLGNSGTVTLDGVTIHDCPRDGLLWGDVGGAEKIGRFVKSVGNGRQGMSLIGGSNYLFADCGFLDTGQGRIYSPPGAGVDIEAECSPVRQVRFVRSRFAGCKGAGLVADSGDSANVTFDACTFSGLETWAAWVKKPGFRFNGGTIEGAVIPLGDADPSRATKFMGTKFVGRHENGPVINAGGDGGDNVLLDSCTFQLDGPGTAPVIPGAAIVRKCKGWPDPVPVPVPPASARKPGLLRRLFAWLLGRRP